jgi:hypothetical protein
VSVALPPLEAMLNGHGTAWANGAPLSRHFGVWWFANGVKADRWVPSATGTGWAPSPSLQPFADAGLLSDCSVVTNMNMPWEVKWAHATGSQSVLVGGEPLYDSSNFPATRAGPTVDEALASYFNGQTPFNRIDLGISRAVSGAEYLTGDPASPMYNPQALFDQLFMGFMPGSTGPTPAQLAARTSILDAVQADANKLKARLGTHDQARLDQHLSQVRSLEMRLATLPQMNSCTLPQRPGPRPADLGGLKEPLEEVNAAMTDLLVMALACDLTRVFRVDYMVSQSAPVFWQVNVMDPHHNLGHNEPSPQPQIQSTIVFMMKQLAVLAAKMKAVPMGASNLLQQSLVLATSEQNDPQDHGLFNVPSLLVGHAGGALKTGVHFQGCPDGNSRNQDSAKQARLLLTILKAMGHPATGFGVGAGQTGAPIADLLA